MHGTLFVILGLAGLLFIASFLLPIAQRVNFPYTVLLAVAGSVLGGVVLVVGEVQGLWLLGDFLNALDELDITSEAVFFIFLPTLIFESALNISARHLMEDIGPILLLAVLGLLISTLVVGASVWAVTGVGLVACLLLGTIVSATDPVAVVAIFKDLGAPKRLTILVEGESLFNDATAIVLFTILAGILFEGGQASPGGAVGRFVLVFLGGVMVGLVTAWIVTSIIGRLHNMPLIEITLTVCLAYFSYLFAEHYLHVSGVMAVVSAGLFTRSVGRTKVSPSTWHALLETWEQLGFWANSLIFFLVGLLVPKVLADFRGQHLLALAVLIASAFAARAVVLYGVLPAMNHLGLGQRVSRAFRTVMLWGGLRGAVSLALALVILENPAAPEDLKQFFAVLVTGFVLFTLFVNATTMRPLLGFFNLDKLPTIDLAMRNRIMALSLSHIQRDLAAAARDYRIDESIAERVSEDYHRRLGEIRRNLSEDGELSHQDLLRAGLTALATREHELYLQRFTEGLIGARIARRLLVMADNLLDAVKIGGTGAYRDAVDRALGFGSGFRLALVLHQRYHIDSLLADRLACRFEELRAAQAVVRELIVHTREQGTDLFGEAVSRELVALLERRYEATWDALSALRLQFPDYAKTVQTRHLGRVALRLEEADYQRMLANNVISQEVFDQLLRDLDRRARDLDRQPQLDLGLDAKDLVAQVPMFAELDRHQLEEVGRLLKPRLAVPGEQIMRPGETGDAMYFISSGAVEILTRAEPVQLGSGDFFGAIALITRKPRQVGAKALGYCRLLVLSARDFDRLLDTHPNLRQTVTDTVHRRLQTWFGSDEGELIDKLR